MSIALPYIRDGRLLALGVTGTQRPSVLPQVPTIAEAGISGSDFKFWLGLWAPAATPSAVIDKLSKDVAAALDDPELRERFAQLGAEPMRMTPSEFAGFVRREADEAARLIQAAGIRAQ